MNRQAAQVHDLGYRAYEGQRAGIGWAMWSLIVHAIRRVFGLKRPVQQKILPAIVLLVAFVPALVIVGFSIFLGSEILIDGGIPSYSEYTGVISRAIVVFTAFVAPDVLSSDRRTGMLALYLASPLDRTTYVASKLAAIFVSLLTMTMAPLLFLLLANTFAGAGPSFGEFFKLLAQIVGTGTLLALFYTGLSAALSSLTPRRGIASVIIVLVLILPPIVVAIILEASSFTDNVGIFDFLNLPTEAGARLFGDTTQVSSVAALSDTVAIGATLLFGVVGAAFAWWRYQSIEVAR